MAETLPSNVPAHLRPGLRALGEALEPLVPTRLAAAMLYGGIAKGKAFTETSDVNLLVVLPKNAPDALAAVAKPLAEARRQAGVSPLIVSEGELDQAMRAFPVKFYDICRHHLPWIGSDPLAKRNVPREWLRENARQGLANLSLRLKRLYVDRAGSPDGLLRGLVDMTSAALVAFRPVLHEKAPPVPDKREDVMESIARVTALSPLPLRVLLSIKKGQPIPAGADPAALHRALLEAVEAAARELA